jgi:hypothetical protein
LKLSVLVAQYFYQHKKVNLPGIGTFFLDDAVTVPDANDKNFRDFVQHIQFKQANIQKPDEALINFICTNTRKIRPLAESDLDSYVADGKLLLNIGKPFHVEGIGTLYKNKEGIFEFTPGEPILQRIEPLHPHAEREGPKAVKKKSVFEEANTPVPNTDMRRLLVIGGIGLALVVVIWGGYSLYNKNVQPSEPVSNPIDLTSRDTPSQKPNTIADSMSMAPVTPSTETAVTKPATGSYKYILETTVKKRRALTRFANVHLISPRILMETVPDSSVFKIYTILPGLASDTTRIKDSLNAWYYGTKPLKVTIEQ